MHKSHTQPFRRGGKHARPWTLRSMMSDYLKGWADEFFRFSMVQHAA